MSSHQSPIGRSRQQQPRMKSPLFSTSDDNTAISNLSSKSSTITDGAEGSNSCIGSSTSSRKPAVKTEDKLQKDITNRALSKKAQMENDAMVYLDGPQIYTCGQCRTHLTSHDDIISKSFHGRHGMFLSCVWSWCYCFVCIILCVGLWFAKLCIGLQFAKFLCIHTLSRLHSWRTACIMFSKRKRVLIVFSH